MTDTPTPAPILAAAQSGRDMHSISGVIARQLYLAHDVRANIERQIDDALRTARNEALEDAAQLVFPDISFSQGLEIATAIRALKS